MKEFYTVEQISKILGMHPKTIQRYIREGKLNAVKVGKSWRVTGHDLSVFTESEDKTFGENGKKKSLKCKTKVSAVIDIDVEDDDEAMRISNTLTAVYNSKDSEYGKATMNTQYIKFEQKLRVMIWGNIKFVENMIGCISVLEE